MSTKYTPSGDPLYGDDKFPDSSSEPPPHRARSDYDSPPSDGSPQSDDRSNESTERRYRERVADALHTSADKANEWSAKGPGATTRPLRSAGEGLDRAADYLGAHDLTEVYDDVLSWAKENPGTALAAAAATGFFVGLAINAAPARPSRYER